MLPFGGSFQNIFSTTVIAQSRNFCAVHAYSRRDSLHYRSPCFSAFPAKHSATLNPKAVSDPAELIALAEAVREVGGSAGLTIYPSEGHDSWSLFRRQPDSILNWLFKQGVDAPIGVATAVDWQSFLGRNRHPPTAVVLAVASVSLATS